MTVCEHIDSILNERGMSRRKLAIRAGIAPSSFQSAMERNTKLPLDMLIPIAQTLDISIDDLAEAGSLTTPQRRRSMRLDTKRNIGNAGLSMAIAYFGANGYTVSVPLNDTQDYDLIQNAL